MRTGVWKAALAIGMSIALILGATVGLLTGASAADAAEEEVLYEQNFDGLTDLPEGWEIIHQATVKGGSVTVENGELLINAKDASDTNPMGAVYLGEELKGVSGFTVEMDYTPVEALNDRRWSSLMYNIQDKPFGKTYAPYYHFAIRLAASASDAVELTGFNTKIPFVNDWDYVVSPISAGYDLKPGTTYKMKVIVVGNQVQEYLNGELMIAATVDESKHAWVAGGGIGVQTSSMNIRVDNIRVTRTAEMPKPVIAGLADVYEPQTGIKVAPTVLQRVDSREDYDALNTEGVRPATAMFTLDADLNVLAADGSVIASLQEALAKIGNAIIPGFTVNDEATVDALSLAVGDLKDATVFSSDARLLSKAHAVLPKLRTAYMPQAPETVTSGTLDQWVADGNTNAAKILVLDGSKLTKDQVLYLQVRLMTVWLTTSGDAFDSADQMMKGADGLVTDSYEESIAVIESFRDEQNGLVRSPVTIAHRGWSNQYPENTMASFRAAVEAGATCIETDFHMTKDGVLVLMHDETVDRTTNGKGAIADMTWDEISRLKCNNIDGSLSNEGVPKMSDLFDYVRDKDVMVVMEIKNSDPNSLQPFVDLVREYGLENRIVAPSFVLSQIAKMREIAPEIGVGWFGYSKGSGTAGDRVLGVLSTVLNLEGTLHPQRDAIDAEMMEMAKHRGIAFHCWTYDTLSAMHNGIRFGIQSLTANGASWLTDQYSYLVPLENGSAVPGDLDGDNEVDMADALRTYKFITGRGYVLPEHEQWAADINADGAVDMADALQIYLICGGFSRQTSGSVATVSALPAYNLTMQQNVPKMIRATVVAQEGGATAAVKVGLVRVGGDDITFTQNPSGTVYADKQGTAVAVLKYEVEQYDGSYTIYSAPITVQVGTGSTTPPEPEPEKPTTALSTTTAPYSDDVPREGFVKELSLQVNNPKAWWVKDVKKDVQRYVPNEYAVYPDIRIQTDEAGNLVIIRSAYSEQPYVRCYANVGKAVNIVDNKLYYDFTAECRWNISLAVGSGADTVNLMGYITKQSQGVNADFHLSYSEYVTDGAAGTYTGCLDLREVFKDACTIKDSNVSGDPAPDGNLTVRQAIIWTVSGTEEVSKIVVRDLFIGREAA